ncbi:hypothetical protein [Serratia symbiotica]|uniref:hypothetical protein n=1 Tax=Serratia symbiotica TaxID=138074 RepID=UPI00135F392C|nr:hypothetical protein [Serratia symbiotica]MBQ0955952.1 hypothetical protein [Serratia symbiotica]
MLMNNHSEMEIINRMLQDQIQESQNLARQAQQNLEEIKRQLEPYQFNSLASITQNDDDFQS